MSLFSENLRQFKDLFTFEVKERQTQKCKHVLVPKVTSSHHMRAKISFELVAFRFVVKFFYLIKHQK